MPAVVNLDGRIVPPREAVVSVFDRGFLYGDSVYEVIRTYRMRPFETAAHLARLAHSAERIGLALRWDAERTAAEIARTLDASAGGDAPAPEAAPWNAGERYVRVVMTRGAGEIGVDPTLAADPLALVIVQPLSAPSLEDYKRGVSVRIVGVEHTGPRTVDPTAKTGSRIENVLAVQEARRGGAHEALMLDRHGFVTEGASSNVFIVKDGAIQTPPLDAGILAGVTRGLVLRLAAEQQLPVIERRLAPADLAAADELFITSTAREILPVVRLDGAPVGAGSPGEVTFRLHQAFRKLAST
jgi:branched-chain amino acid aminotransferase